MFSDVNEHSYPSIIRDGRIAVLEVCKTDNPIISLCEAALVQQDAENTHQL